MILCQPHVYGGTGFTVPGVRKHWEDFAARNGSALHSDDREVEAFVNDNRWLADCPSCGAGMACWPENPEAACLGCFSVFRVKFPQDRVEAEKVLEERPPANRHWNPRTEDVKKLERENTLMKDIEQRPSVPIVEPVRSVFTVEHVHEGDLDKELLLAAKTGYVIRYDRVAQVAEVELVGRSDSDAAQVKKKIVGK